MHKSSKPFIGSGCTFYAKSPGRPAATKCGLNPERCKRRHRRNGRPEVA